MWIARAQLAEREGDGFYYAEQKSRMVSTDNTVYMYVVEGSLGRWDGSCRGMKHTCMWAALTKTCLRDHIPVFHTLTETDTASLCAYVWSRACP